MNNLPSPSSISGASSQGHFPITIDPVAVSLAIHRLDQATQATREQLQTDAITQVRLTLELGGVVNVSA